MAKKPVVPKRKERGELLGFLLQKKQKINGAQDQSELSEFPKESKHHGVETEMIKPNACSSNSPF